MSDFDDDTMTFEEAVDASLLDNFRMIIGGVATLVAIVVPVILIRKLVKEVENSNRYKSIEDALK